MPLIRTGKVILLCAIAAAIALGFVAWAYGPWITGKKISAGAIEFSPATNPQTLQGSFKIFTSPSQNAIRGNGTGGACLVADLNRFNFPTLSGGQSRKCTENSDCNQGLPSGWRGYCDADGERTCWVRRGPDKDDLCNKSPFEPWEEGVDHPSNTTPFDLAKPRYPEHAPLESFSRAYPGPVRWRVVACLNGIDPTTQPYHPGCRVTDPEHKEIRMEVFGPIRTPPHVHNPGPNQSLSEPSVSQYAQSWL